MSDINDDLIKALPIGRENAIHQKDIANLMGVKPNRVKILIQYARKEGYRICSGSEGYWIAKDDQEMQFFIRSMRNQAIKRFITIKSINNSLKNCDGQMSLSDSLYGVSEEVDGDGTKETI